MAARIVREAVHAQKRLDEYIFRTPLKWSLPYSQIAGCEVFFKLENLQHTGSFKVRGALHALSQLSAEERARGVVTASSGNHGAAVAYGLKSLGCRGTIFVPEDISPIKAQGIRRYGGEIRYCGTDSGLAQVHAHEYADAQGLVYISPYNDDNVMSGQATVGIEIYERLQQIDAIFVPVGGGGLVCGIASYLKSRMPGLRVIGCQAANSSAMADAVRAGRVVRSKVLPTLADGTAGNLEPGTRTVDLCRELVDDWELVSEDEIRGAICRFMTEEHMLIEGAAATAVAALLRRGVSCRGKNVVVVVSGGNVSLPILRDILGEGDAR